MLLTIIDEAGNAGMHLQDGRGQADVNGMMERHERNVQHTENGWKIQKNGTRETFGL
jgi:hypothetical protein